MWTDEQLRMLINERKENNEYYHDLVSITGFLLYHYVDHFADHLYFFHINAI